MVAAAPQSRSAYEHGLAQRGGLAPAGQRIEQRVHLTLLKPLEEMADRIIARRA